MKKLMYIIPFVLIVACNSATKLEPPEDLIPKKEMVALLTDMHIAASTYNVNNLEEIKNLNYTAVVFEKYQIDSVRFMRSNQYYASQTKDYLDMFKKVQDSLLAIQDLYKTELDSIIEQDKILENQSSGGQLKKPLKR